MGPALQAPIETLAGPASAPSGVACLSAPGNDSSSGQFGEVLQAAVDGANGGASAASSAAARAPKPAADPRTKAGAGPGGSKEPSEADAATTSPNDVASQLAAQLAAMLSLTPPALPAKSPGKGQPAPTAIAAQASAKTPEGVPGFQLAIEVPDAAAKEAGLRPGEPPFPATPPAEAALSAGPNPARTTESAAATAAAMAANAPPQPAGPASAEPGKDHPDGTAVPSPNVQPAGQALGPATSNAATLSAISVVRIDGNATQGKAGNDEGDQGKHEGSSPPVVRALAPAADGSQGLPFAAPAGTTTANLTAATNLNATPSPTTPAALPPPVVQVAQTVIDQVTKGGGEARIHLHPAELGDVLIRVRTDGDKVHLDVHADRADAQQLLRDHTQELSSLLGSRGLNLADVNIGFGGQGAGNTGRDGQAASNNNPQAANGEFAALMGAGEPAATGLHNRLQSAYNPDGALSYRI